MSVVRHKGQTTCVHHGDEPLKLYCCKCDDPICSLCLVDRHEGHKFAAIPDRKQEITDFIENAEIKDIQIQQLIKSGYDTLEKDAAQFSDLDTGVEKQQEVLKKDTDVLVDNTRGSYREIKEENAIIITSYITNLEAKRTILRQAIEECEDVVQTGSDIQMFDTRKKIRGLDTSIPVKPEIGTADFTPNTNPQRYLEQALGQASVTRSPTPASNKDKHPDSNPKYPLLHDAVVMGEFESPCYISAICATSDGAWTSYHYSNTVTQINREGEVLQKIKYKVHISDVSVSPITNNVWTCSSQDRNIMEHKPKRKLVIRFSTDVQPHSLCCTLDGCLLVGMCNKLTKFDTKGKVLLTTTSSQSGRPLVCTPHRITECSVTHNIAVVDRDWSSDGGEDKPRVIIINSDFQELFQYTGIVPSSQQRITKTRSRPFNLIDARYDTVGNIVIADCSNCCLHLLSGSGEYMRLLHTDSDLVWYVGIDKTNVLWAGFGVGASVKLLQYTGTMCDA